LALRWRPDTGFESRKKDTKTAIGWRMAIGRLPEDGAAARGRGICRIARQVPEAFHNMAGPRR
jgi:hypothetical protein